jgi:hypothetical protein
MKRKMKKEGSRFEFRNIFPSSKIRKEKSKKKKRTKNLTKENRGILHTILMVI